MYLHLCHIMSIAKVNGFVKILFVIKPYLTETQSYRYVSEYDCNL